MDIVTLLLGIWPVYGILVLLPYAAASLVRRLRGDSDT